MTMPKLFSILLFLGLGLLPRVGKAQSDAVWLKVSQSKEWHRLMHYQRWFYLGWLRSEVDGQGFFFAADGKTNPLAELKASVEAFSKDLKVGKLKLHPQCSFPQRYRFVKKALELKIPDVPCPQVDEFIDKFHAKSLTLVFSSAYPHNPGSMFGHTFFRINSESKEHKKLDLLDLGVSFAALVPPDENGFAFAYYGLVGGYLGQWSIMPYYEKVNEYVNSESRDIWEYDLDVNKDETEGILRHVWELDNNSYFFYYFLDENCSYQLLALLEVVKPDWNLTTFPIYVIPAETVKRVASVPNAITSIKYRPSHQKKMFQLYDGLNPEQRKIYFKIIGGPQSAETVASTGDKEVLDAAGAYFFYQKQKDISAWPKGQSDLLSAVLIRRSELGPPKPEAPQPLPSEARPDLGHFTYRLGVGTGSFGAGSFGAPSAQGFNEIAFRFSYHDLMNNDQGYPPFSQIEFPGVIVRQFPNQNMVSVEKFEGLGLLSLSPFSFIESHPSYEFDFNVISPKDYCLTCHVIHGEGGGGAAWKILPHMLFYSFLLANGEVGDAFSQGYRWGPRLQMAVISNPVPRYKIRLAADGITDLAQGERQKLFYQFTMNQSVSLSQSFDFRIDGFYILKTSSTQSDYEEVKGSLYWYF